MTTSNATLSANVVGRVAPRAPQPTYGVICAEAAPLNSPIP